MKNAKEQLDKHGTSPSDINDFEAFNSLIPEFREWWLDQFGEYIEQNNGLFTPPQKKAIPSISNGQNTLIASPTGSGKTLSSLGVVLNELFKKSKEENLQNSVYAIYISPLKSLANDIHKNLEKPLDGILNRLPQDTQEIRHAIRHGDTPSSERQKMLKTTPHILNTTPETLSILLNSPKFKKKLETVEYIIVDEIHSLADNKRGVHLSVSLERLENMCQTQPTRIGCSATVEPLDTIGQFLVGYNDNREPRDFTTVDTRFLRDYNLRVETPVDDLIRTPQPLITEKFYNRVHELIKKHKTTLIFTNSRSGAESTLEALRKEYPRTYTQENSAAHHGSLSKEKREEVETGLKTGQFDVVTTSTSLELGIDMQDIDLVIQVGSPKSISSLLQRIGRAGHKIGQTVEGRIIALDRSELIETTVMADRAQIGFIDRVFIPENAHDVATQHVYGMAINGPFRERTIKETLRRAYPYKNYSDEDFELLFRYMTADYEEMGDHNVYPKIWRDSNDPPSGEHHYDEFDIGDKLIGKRGRQARVIYMTNIGTIPDTFTVQVYTRNDTWVGDLDEEYLNTLEKGDVFVLGGKNYRYKYRRGSKVYVDQTKDAPTVPSWFSERLPLSYDLGKEILKFQENIIRHLNEGGDSEVSRFLRDFPVGPKARNSIARLYEEQRQYTGVESLSTPNKIAVEEHIDQSEGEKHYYVRTIYGRRFNDGLSRLVGHYVTNQNNTNIEIAVNDHGFALTVPLRVEIDIENALTEITPRSLRERLRDTLQNTDFIKRYFRINATRSLMVLRNYKGHEKSAKQQQMASEMLLGYIQSLDDPVVVLEETYREIIEDKLNMKGLSEIISRLYSGQIDIETKRVQSPSPRAFTLAALSSNDVMKAEDESAVLKKFHERIMEETDSM